MPKWFWPLAAVVALGFLLRLANLIDTSGSPFFTRPVIDGQVYDQWALAIKAGRAPQEPFYQDPLYPYFLAMVYAVFGHSFWAAYLLQLLMGVVLLYLVFDITRRLFDWRAALAAALLGALYKPFLFYEVQIEKTAVAVFLCALFLWALVRGLESLRSGWALASGLSLGLAALTRANLLIFAPALPFVFFFAPKERREGKRQWSEASGRGPVAGGRSGRIPATSHQSPATTSLLPAILSAVGVLVIIAPVAIRNSRLAHEFVLTTTQGGQNLYIGNSPYNNTGQYQAPPWVRPHPDYEQVDFREYARKAVGHELSYSGTSAFYTRAALQWAAGHPGSFFGLLGRKVMLYFNNFEVPDNQDIYFFSRYSWVLRLPLLMFGVVFGLGFAGVILLLRRSPGRWALLVFFVVYAISVVVFFVFSRYRLPAVPALLPFAGGVVIRLWDSARGKRGRRLRMLAPAVLLVVAGGAMTAWPIPHKPKDEAAQCLVNLATQYYHEGDTARAMSTFREALGIQPNHAEALRNMGTIALSRGQLDEGFDLLSRAEQSDPGNPVTHHMLGKAWEQRHMTSQANVEYRRAVSLAPGRVEYRFALASTLHNLDSLAPALAQYDTMIALAPDNPLVRHNHAVALFRAGRVADARAELDTTRRLGGQVNPSFEAAVRAALRQ